MLVGCCFYHSLLKYHHFAEQWSIHTHCNNSSCFSSLYTGIWNHLHIDNHSNYGNIAQSQAILMLHKSISFILFEMIRSILSAILPSSLDDDQVWFLILYSVRDNCLQSFANSLYRSTSPILSQNIIMFCFLSFPSVLFKPSWLFWTGVQVHLRLNCC